MTMATNEAKTEVKARRARQPATILIVEDEALVASYIQEVLEESGFIIAGVASSGPEAMSLVSANPPDLALVDIKLAGPMDGIEVAQLMRTQFNVHSIFLSGVCDPRDDGTRPHRNAPGLSREAVPSQPSVQRATAGAERVVLALIASLKSG